MADQQVKENSSDEIDLGQLFQIIGKVFNKLGIAILHIFLYLKKNVFILGGLTILGVGVGIGLNQIIQKRLKIEIIVRPNLESENYLYNVVEEIDNNIKSRDSIFFKGIGAPTRSLEQFKIFVEPISYGKQGKVDIEYLELLEKFNESGGISDIIRSELLKNTTLNHRITLTFKEPSDGKLFAQKTMDYINSSEYFKALVETNNNNAKIKIAQNELLISQIDELVSGFSQNLGQVSPQNLDFQGKILFGNDEQMDLTGLLRFKDLLLQNTEKKKIELKEQMEPISVINFGRPQQFSKPLFESKIVLIPSLLLVAFLGISFLRFLNQKSKGLKQN